MNFIKTVIIELIMDRNFLILLRYVAILGNIMFILWITYNGIDEGFKGTVYQKLSYIGLVSLLILNIGLLYHKK
jgi:hypothetical protein